MTTVVLYVGIAVAFLTVWGVIMVGAYLLGERPADAPSPDTARLAAETPATAIDTAAAGARLR